MTMIEVKTAILIGPALNWAVAKAVGYYMQADMQHLPPVTNNTLNPEFWRPSSDWSVGGPLIEQYSISFNHYCTGGVDERGELRDALFACIGYRRTISGKNADARAPRGQYLVAACRAIVIARLGETVQVPEALLS